MEENNVLALIFARNAFYRRMHFLALAAFMFTLFVIIFLSWVLYSLIKNPTPPLYFATDSMGRLIQIIPVNKPNMSTEEVTAWTIAAVEAAYSFDYVNYRAQLQNAQRFFTSYGWRNYMEALTASNNILALTQRKQIAVAKVIDKPRLITEGILSGAYAWKFEMPVLVNYSVFPFDEKSLKYSNAIVVTVIVQRQPILQSYRGLGIVQLVSTLANTSTPRELSVSPPG